MAGCESSLRSGRSDLGGIRSQDASWSMNFMACKVSGPSPALAGGFLSRGSSNCHFCPKPTWLPQLLADPLSLCLLFHSHSCPLICQSPPPWGQLPSPGTVTCMYTGGSQVYSLHHSPKEGLNWLILGECGTLATITQASKSTHLSRICNENVRKIWRWFYWQQQSKTAPEKVEEGRLEEEDMTAVGPSHPQEALGGGGWNLWVYGTLEAIPTPREDKNIQHRAQRNAGEGGSVPHRCSLKVLPGRQAQITEAVQLRSRITGEQVGLLSLIASAGGSLPSYKKVLGFILCNFFPGRKTA